MNSKCYDCPRTKEYIDMGGCPNCLTKQLFMNTKTHMATCEVCGVTWGIPMAIVGLCDNDERNKRYTISIDANLNKQQLLGFAKLTGYRGTEAYRLFKNNTPVVLKDIPMVLTYKIRNFFRSADITITITPPIDEYHLFEECWRI